MSDHKKSRHQLRALRFYVDDPLEFVADLIGVASLFIMLWGGLLAASVLS